MQLGAVKTERVGLRGGRRAFICCMLCLSVLSGSHMQQPQLLLLLPFKVSSSSHFGALLLLDHRDGSSASANAFQGSKDRFKRASAFSLFLPKKEMLPPHHKQPQSTQSPGQAQNGFPVLRARHVVIICLLRLGFLILSGAGPCVCQEILMFFRLSSAPQHRHYHTLRCPDYCPPQYTHTRTRTHHLHCYFDC